MGLACMGLHIHSPQSSIVKLCLAVPFLGRVKDKCKLQQTFSVDPIYLRHDNSGATDFMVQKYPTGALLAEYSFSDFQEYLNLHFSHYTTPPFNQL